MTSKFNYMQRILQASLVAALVLTLAACGSSSKDKNASLTDKKAELQKLKDQQKKLEDEIAKIDTGAGKEEKPNWSYYHPSPLKALHIISICRVRLSRRTFRISLPAMVQAV